MKDPPLTYRGALRLLGSETHPLLETLSKIVGFGILASAAVPTAAFGVLWQSVDQKNECVRVVESLLSNIRQRLLRTSGVSRHHLITAAHAIIVVDAFFGAVEDALGRTYRKLGISDAAKIELIRNSKSVSVGPEVDPRRSLVEHLYHSEIPIPSAHRGFEEILRREMHSYLEQAASYTMEAVKRTAAWTEAKNEVGPIDIRATITIQSIQNYRDSYIRLAADVPEFSVWANYGEHAATRTALMCVRTDLVEALAQNSVSLSKLERLLEFSGPTYGQEHRTQETVLRLSNKGILRHPLLKQDEVSYIGDIKMPSIEEGYITPNFRAIVYRTGRSPDTGASPGSDQWWEENVPLRTDLDSFLAAHFTSPYSARQPLLVLGMPGAGKSLFTEVLSARLPVESFTVVNVPLRRVNSAARVYAQVNEALDLQTHTRVAWNGLTEPEQSRIRVVLFDGLDELLRAPGGEMRVGYLQEVTDFQTREIDMERPVAAVVTARTLVADWMPIPEGCLIVRLEGFDDAQIRRWLETWHKVNAAGLSAGTIQELRPAAAIRHRSLAAQPLLLMMLALYTADRSAASLDDASLSTAELYGRLADTFLRRESTKSATLDPDKIDLIEERLWKLRVAALAMFNRGSQHISEDDLTEDIAALTDPEGTGRKRDHGRTAERTIAGFFFVYTSQAISRTDRPPARTFEFLHATFQEFLVASSIADELMSLSHLLDARVSRRSEVSDDLLFAMLSHQVLSTSGSILSFLNQLFSLATEAERRSALETAQRLLSAARRRHGTDRFSRYQPIGEDIVRATAAYVANLVLIAVLLSDGKVDVCPFEQFDMHERRMWWKSTKYLCIAGLGEPSTDTWDRFLAGTDVPYL